MATETNPPQSGAVGTFAQMSDAALLEAIGASDKAAFAEFFGRYAGRVRGFLLKFGAKPADADELAQEVMVTVWRKATLFDAGRASAGTWLFTIARNRWLDLIRKQSRPEPDPNDPVFQPEPEPDGVSRLAALEREAQLRAAVAELSPAQREVLIAGFFRGLSQSEIAEELQVPLGTVKSRTRLAFERLRDVLGETLLEELKYD